IYICVFSRSDGAGSATNRKTRGLTRSVIARIVPPLPAASRPSKTMMIRRPLYLTQSCSLQSSACSRRISFSYFLRFRRPSSSPFLLSCFLPIGKPLCGWRSKEFCLLRRKNQDYGNQRTCSRRNLENNGTRSRDQKFVVGIARADIEEIYDR